MMDLIRSAIDWVGVHPYAASAIVGLVAFGESLAFVGLLVPGALFMFAAGALIANGTLAFWPIALCAVAGAILGDGASYSVGRVYRGRVRWLWPFSKHPGFLERAEQFFYRHGGKSVVLGRFVGPVRPFIPVVAGMLGMQPARFYVTNVLSALGWAPAYLLPGMAFGASLALAGEVAGRLAALFAILLVSIWTIAWLVRTVFRAVQPHAEEWAQQCLRWARGHRRVKWLIGDLIDPLAPASRGLLLWIALLVAGTWVFIGIVQDVVNQDQLVRADEAIYRALQSLRTPLGDRIMIVFSELGDWPVTMATTVAALAWLGWRRARRDAFYWLTAIAFAWLSVVTLKLLLQLPRPVVAYSGWEAYGFPSGHATMSVVIYGYLAVLAARYLPVRWRWLAYAAGAMLIAGIAFSRLYLGVHWVSDVAAGLGMGTVGVSVIAIARQRHIRTDRARGTVWVALAALVLAGAWHASTALPGDLERYAVRRAVTTMAEARWWQTGWRELPAYRIDLGGEEEQPLNVQWAGSLSVLRAQLADEGWTVPVALGVRSALRWIAPALPLSELPLIPRLHDGRAEALTMILGNADPEQQRELLLRLWPSSFELEPGDRSVWVGTVTWLRVQRLPLLRLPRTAGTYDDAASKLVSSIQGLDFELQPRVPGQNTGGYETLLLRP